MAESTVQITEEIDEKETTYNSPKRTSWKDHLSVLNDDEDISHLSKNQQKKVLKRKLYLNRRMEKRKEERARKKAKRVELKEAGLPIPTRLKNKNLARKQPCAQNIVLDLDFADLMNESDIRMLIKQVKSSYAANRKLLNPAQFHLTSFTGALKDTFVNYQPGCVNWMLNSHDGNYLSAFERDRLVYLTADSENMLEQLNPNDIYVIGGLVDHNQHKGLCHHRAVENNIRHAQLPISEYVQLNTRRVLTVNHVVEILLHCMQSGDWKEAFFSVIPKRKGINVLETNKDSEKSKTNAKSDSEMSRNNKSQSENSMENESKPEISAMKKETNDDVKESEQNEQEDKEEQNDPLESLDKKENKGQSSDDVK